MHKWNIYKNMDLAAKAAADFIAQNIESYIQNKDICHVALPGGNTPIPCLQYLAEKGLPWSKVHWYLGDERCYPKGHAERNDVMLEKYLWSHINNTNIHRISAEKGPNEAAALYSELISSIECVDIAFLGIGEDGHTASLFPDNKALDDTRPVVPVYNSPKAPDERVSLSVTTLNKARCRVVLAGGIEKAAILSRIKSGDSLPINCLGGIDWFIDEAAM